jgi:hypothetical protein
MAVSGGAWAAVTTTPANVNWLQTPPLQAWNETTVLCPLGEGSVKLVVKEPLLPPVSGADTSLAVWQTTDWPTETVAGVQLMAVSGGAWAAVTTTPVNVNWLQTPPLQAWNETTVLCPLGEGSVKLVVKEPLLPPVSGDPPSANHL